MATPPPQGEGQEGVANPYNPSQSQAPGIDPLTPSTSAATLQEKNAERDAILAKAAAKIEGGLNVDATKNANPNPSTTTTTAAVLIQQQQQQAQEAGILQCNLELLALEFLRTKQEVSRLQSENDKWCEEYLKMKSYNELITKLLHSQGLTSLQMPFSAAPERHHPQLSSILSQSSLFGQTLLQAANFAPNTPETQAAGGGSVETPQAQAAQAAQSSLAAASLSPVTPITPMTPSPAQEAGPRGTGTGTGTGPGQGMPTVPVPIRTFKSSASELRSTPQLSTTTTIAGAVPTSTSLAAAAAAAPALKTTADLISEMNTQMALNLVKESAGASARASRVDALSVSEERGGGAGGGGGGGKLQPTSTFPFGVLLKSNSNVSSQETALRLQQLHDLQAAAAVSSAFAGGGGGGGGSGGGSVGGKKKEERGKKRNRGLNLPRKAVRRLKEFLYDHFDNPYPSETQKSRLARELGLDVNQVNTWFINARMRLWKPLIEKVFNQMKTRLEASLDACKAKRQVNQSGTSAESEREENEKEVNTLLEKLNKVKEAEDPRAKVAFMMTDEWSEREMQQTKARLSQELEIETQAHQVWAAEADI